MATKNIALDAPESFEFTVGKSKKAHSIPLMASLPFSWNLRFAEVSTIGDESLRNLEALKAQGELLAEYMGEDAAKLTTAQVAEIFARWAEASAAQGADAGE